MIRSVIGQERKSRAEVLLNGNPDIDVQVDWDNAFMENTKQLVPTTCRKCETEKIKTVCDLVIGRFYCTPCAIQSYQHGYNTLGYTYLSHTQRHATIRCNSCNTTQETQLSNLSALLRKGQKPKCEVCLEKKYTDAIEKTGYEYLSRTIDSNSNSYVTLRCPLDGNIIEALVHDAMQGKLICEECRISTYRTTLESRGCHYISSESKTVRGYTKRIVKYRTKDGQEFEKVSSDILTGSFATGENSNWSSDTSTYLVVTKHNDQVYCKIGTANIPEQRMKRLKLLGESKVFTLSSFSDRFGADKLETELHKEFKQFKLDPNIADLFTGGVVKAKRVGQVERATRKDGRTEWFTHEVYDILKDRYKLE